MDRAAAASALRRSALLPLVETEEEYIEGEQDCFIVLGF